MRLVIVVVLLLTLSAASDAQFARPAGTLTPQIDALLHSIRTDRLNSACVLVAPHVVNKRNEMDPFLRTILARPSLFTTIVSSSRDGMSVSRGTR